MILSQTLKKHVQQNHDEIWPPPPTKKKKTKNILSSPRQVPCSESLPLGAESFSDPAETRRREINKLRYPTNVSRTCVNGQMGYEVNECLEYAIATTMAGQNGPSRNFSGGWENHGKPPNSFAYFGGFLGVHWGNGVSTQSPMFLFEQICIFLDDNYGCVPKRGTLQSTVLVSRKQTCFQGSLILKRHLPVWIIPNTPFINFKSYTVDCVDVNKIIPIISTCPNFVILTSVRLVNSGKPSPTKYSSGWLRSQSDILQSEAFALDNHGLIPWMYPAILLGNLSK